MVEIEMLDEADFKFVERTARRKARNRRLIINMVHSAINLIASFLIPLVTLPALHIILSIALWISCIYVLYIIVKNWPGRKEFQ